MVETANLKVRAKHHKLPLTALITQQTSIFGFVCSTKQKGLGHVPLKLCIKIITDMYEHWLLSTSIEGEGVKMSTARTLLVYLNLLIKFYINIPRTLLISRY